MVICFNNFQLFFLYQNSCGSNREGTVESLNAPQPIIEIEGDEIETYHLTIEDELIYCDEADCDEVDRDNDSNIFDFIDKLMLD